MSDDIAAAPSAAPNTGASAPTGGPVASSPASATATPAAATPQPQGPIPFDRHKEILDGAYGERDTARKALEDYQQQYGWASQVNPDEFRQIQQWSQLYRQSPLDWYSSVTQDLRNAYPDLAPALTSQAAKILGASRGQQAPAAIEPKIPVLDSTGNVIDHAYSAQQVQQIVQQAIVEALGPVKQTLSVQQAEREEQQHRAAGVQDANRIYAQAQQWHGFKEHEAEIAKVFAAHEDWSLQDAYLAVLHEKILPSLKHTGQTELLGQLQSQAAGATVHPGSTTPSAKPKFKSPREALEYYDKHPEEAAAMANR